jgi:hypothetical protein
VFVKRGFSEDFPSHGNGFGAVLERKLQEGSMNERSRDYEHHVSLKKIKINPSGGRLVGRWRWGSLVGYFQKRTKHPEIIQVAKLAPFASY